MDALVWAIYIAAWIGVVSFLAVMVYAVAKSARS
jgi:hypothetical protein